MKNQKSKNKQNNRKQIILIGILLLAVIIIAAVIVGMGGSNENSSGEKEPSVQTAPDAVPQTPIETDYSFIDGIDVSDSKDVKVVMNDGQSFVITVLPKVAPETAANFLSLAETGFYDGLIFHRVVKGFVAQGGDPEGTGMGGSEQNIKGEFSENGFENPLSHQRSVVSMARSQDFDSASSQFFICYDDVSMSLDGKYAAFGYVSEGMEVVDTFLSAGTDSSDRPLKDVVIESMTVLE